MLLWTTAKDPKCQEEAYTITCYDDTPFLLEKMSTNNIVHFLNIHIYIYIEYVFILICIFIIIDVYYTILFYGVYMIVMILNHHQFGGNC